MHKKFSFKSSLLVSTALVAGVIASSDAYSRSYRAGGALPSIEINFSVIERLKKEELARIEKERQARNSAEARALSEELRRVTEEQRVNTIKEPEVVRSAPVYKVEEKPTLNKAPENYINNKPAPSEPINTNNYDFTAGNVKDLPFEAAEKVVESVTSFLLPKLKPGTKLVKNEKRSPVEQSPEENKYNHNFVFSNKAKPVQPVDIVNIPAKVRIRPANQGIDNNKSRPVEAIKANNIPQNNITDISGNTEELPTKYDSFIKVNEVQNPQTSDNTNDKEDIKKSKISFFKFPKLFDRKEEPKPYEEVSVEPQQPQEEPIKSFKTNSNIDESSFITVQEGNKVDEVNEFNREEPVALIGMPKQLPSADKVDIKINEESEDSVGITSNYEEQLDTGVNENANIEERNVSVDKSSLQDSESPEPQKGMKDKLFGAFGKISNIKNIFSKKEELKTQDIEADNVVNIEKKTSNINKNESKALIPVEVEELENITHDSTKGGPLYLDSVANINEWKVPEDVAKKLNSSNDKLPEYVSSLGDNVQIVLPNRIDDIQRNKIVPKPKVKPSGSAETAKTKNSKVILNASNKKINSSKKNSKNLKYKAPKSQLLSVNPVSEDKWKVELEKARVNAEQLKVNKVASNKVNQSSQSKNKITDKKLTKKVKPVEKKVLASNIQKKQANNTPDPKLNDKSNGVKNVKDSQQKAEVVYLEDIAKSLKKQKSSGNDLYKSPSSSIVVKNNNPKQVNNTPVFKGNVYDGDYEIVNSKNSNLTKQKGSKLKGSKVTELAGYQMAVPTESFEVKSNKLNNNLSSPLRIKFKSSELNISKSDNEKITKIVSDAIKSNKKLEIVSYAPSNKPENARIISLKRAIAVRAAMLNAGLGSDMVNVHAVGVAQKKNDENSIKISFAN